MARVSSNRSSGARFGIRGTSFLTYDSAPFVFITLCWITAVILVNPVGEFSSVDDWSYASAVRALVERGEIKFSDWTTPNLISQVFWGALFALIFGVSYTALRISTLVAALLGAFALYRLIRDADRPISIALFSALLLLFNPIFFALSFTFMTDVPFVAAQTGAMLFLLAGLRSGSRSASALGWLLALVALLCRQTAFAIPFAYGGAYLVKHGLRAKTLAISVLPLAVFIGVQWAYRHWLDTAGKTPLMFESNLESALPILTGPTLTIVTKLFEVARYLFFYLGLFLLPISLPIVATLAKELRPKAAVALVAGIAAVTVILTGIALRAGLLMPIWGDTWRHIGIGPESSGILGPLWFFKIVTLLSVTGGLLLGVCLADAVYRAVVAAQARSFAAWGLVFGLLGAVASAGVLSLIALKFDRYLLPIIPWLAFAVVFAIPGDQNATLPRWSLLVGSAFLAALAWYSIVNKHNYMAEKQVWTTAIADLVAQGIQRETIDAGWVSNGEALFGRYGDSRRLNSWYKSRDYVVGHQLEPNYSLVRRYTVPRWRIWGRAGGDVLVSELKARPK